MDGLGDYDSGSGISQLPLCQIQQKRAWIQFLKQCNRIQYSSQKRQMFSSLFSNQIQQIIVNGKYIDARLYPSKLIQDFKSPKGKIQILKLSKENLNQEKQLRVLSAISLVLLYSNQQYEFIQSLQLKDIKGTWLKDEVINPFIRWIKKCCQTSNMYSDTKSFSLKPDIFIERIPYIVKMLTDILQIVSFIPKIGRYFSLEKANKVYLMFCEVLLILANNLYSHFKNNFEQFLYCQRKSQLQTQNAMVQWLLNEEIPKFNDIIETVTKNKYFLFYKKGIATKLIKISQYNNQLSLIVNQIICDKSEKSVETTVTSLESLIFPTDGSFNRQLFVSTLRKDYKSARIAPLRFKPVKRRNSNKENENT